MKTIYIACASSLALFSSALAQVQAVPASGAPAPTQASAPAQQVEQRLDRVERALRDLQGAVYSVEQPQTLVPVRSGSSEPQIVPVASNQTPTMPSVSPADLSVRVTALEQSLAMLTGEVERLNYKLDQQARRLEQLEGVAGPGMDAPSSLPPVEGEMSDTPTSDAALSGQPMDLATGEVAAPVTLPDDPEAAYDVAYQAVLGADFEAAEQKLSAFVEKFPSSDQTPEAKFLLGEVYLATGANGEAARVFLDHVGTYKDDPRSPEAYLKLGMSFSRLDRKDKACKVLNVGKSKFSGMSDILRRRYDEERAAANCR